MKHSILLLAALLGGASGVGSAPTSDGLHTFYSDNYLLRLDRTSGSLLALTARGAEAPSAPTTTSPS
ncbi:MAG: hypothetical protein QHJ73_06130 [Armatimonadota bacterium]|nr:hypothetical protein [Armatimonadota bacterium]